MGWTFIPGFTRDKLVADLTKPETFERDGLVQSKKLLDHCLRIEDGQAVLWSVWEVRKTVVGRSAEPVIDRFIGCDLLEARNGAWGYKLMEESMGPYYYSCPLEYFELVPANLYKVNALWREDVRERQGVCQA